MIKQCPICGKEFTVCNSTRKYCSSKCRAEKNRLYMREKQRKNKEEINAKARQRRKQAKKNGIKLGKCSNSYPCRNYQYEFSIPVGLCLKCNAESCRFENG